MLKLLKLRFNNIGPFSSLQEIDFSSKSNLIQIDGKRTDTQGSSGAGKSMICQSIDYLFDLNSTPASKLESRAESGPLTVEADFEDEHDNQYTIRRHRKEGLSISGHINASSNSKIAEEELDKIIGMPRELFGNLIHKKQKKDGFFLNLTGKESYEFLIKCLGLGIQIDLQKKIEDDIKQIKPKIDKTKVEIDFMNQSIDELKLMLNHQKQPTHEVDEVKLKEWESDYQIMIASKKQLEIELSEFIAKVQAPSRVIGDNSIKIKPIYEDIEVKQSEVNKLITERKSLELYTFQKRNELESAKLGIINKLNSISEAKNTIKSKLLKSNELKVLIAELNKQKCPTCLRKWEDENDINTKIKSLQSELDSVTNDILSFKDLLSEEPKTKEDLDLINSNIQSLNQVDYSEFDDKISVLNSEVFELKAKITNIDMELENIYLKQREEYTDKIQLIKDRFEPKIKEANDRSISLDVNYISPAKNKLLTYSKQMEQYLNTVDEMQTSIELKTNSLGAVLKSFEDVNDKLFIAEESKRLIKSYTLKVFEESLEQISFNANQIMFNTPNTSMMKISFETSKESKSGSIKDEVNAVLSINEESNIDIKTLSGGERTALDLAVDLAVMELIEVKTGKGANWLFLDEPFTGLDSINCENIVRMIETSVTNKRIIVIDHNPEIKEFMQDIITIERNGETSNVK